MSIERLHTMRALQAQIEQQRKALEALEQDEDTQRAAEFVRQFHEFAEREGANAEVIAMVGVDLFGADQMRAAITRAAGKPTVGPKGAGVDHRTLPRNKIMYRWTHPETGETWEGTRASGPVSEWIKEHGKDNVKKWRKPL